MNSKTQELKFKNEDFENVTLKEVFDIIDEYIESIKIYNLKNSDIYLDRDDDGYIIRVAVMPSNERILTVKEVYEINDMINYEKIFENKRKNIRYLFLFGIDENYIDQERRYDGIDEYYDESNEESHIEDLIKKE